MRLSVMSVFAGLVFALVVNPVLARPNAGRMDKAQWSPAQASKIGDKDFVAGNYQVDALEMGTTVSVYQGKKLVAEIPCHWTQLSQKAANTAVFTDSANSVTQIQFAGRTAAVQFP